MTQSRSTGGKVKERNGPWWDSNPQVLTPMSPKSNALPLTLPRLLYIIHVPLGTTTVAAVYALLQRKTQDTYEDLFTAIMDYTYQLDLHSDLLTIVCNFEASVIRAVQSVYGPNVEIRGCFYHLTQATWRKIQELGLVPSYRTDENFKLFCGELDGLAFLPIPDIPARMDWIRQHTPAGAEELVNYFDKTYVTGTYRPARPAAGQLAV